MSALVFVATELAPFTAGEAGRVLHNILLSMNEADRSRSTVILVDAAIDHSVFSAIFRGVRFVALDTTKEQPRYAYGRRVPPARAYSTTYLHWQSVATMLAVESLAREMPVEYVEFPDRVGLGFCTLQERRFSGLLAEACIAVRLHSTHTAALNSEATTIDRQDLCIVDMERKCLRDCDLVVTQVPSVSTTVRHQHAIAAGEWDDRVIVHAPPVRLNHYHPVQVSSAASAQQQIVFASAIQRASRPDLFVRGVSTFMRRNSHYTGRAVISARETFGDYEEQITKLIPTDLRPRFHLREPPAPDKRKEMAAKSTIVVSSESGSFCLEAYEASLLGARLIVNATNPAFDDSSPWRDGINCFKFDGTVTGMVDAIERSFASTEPLEVVAQRRDVWPWEHKRSRSSKLAAEGNPLVSVVVSHFNLGDYLAETLTSVLAIDYANLEIVLVDDASTDKGSIALIDALKRSSEPRFKVVRLEGNLGLAAARNVGVRNASGDYVLTLDADDLIDANFVMRAVRALENNPEFDVVVTPAAYFIDGEQPPVEAPVDAVDYAIFIGEARVAGLLENRYSTATAVFRKAVLERFPYNEDLHCYEDWSLYMRMCDASVRFIVTTDVFFFYRRRKNSMVHAPRNPSMRQIEYSDLLRTSAPVSFRAGSRHLVLGLASPLIMHDAVPSAPEVVTTASAIQMEEVLRRTAQIEALLGRTIQTEELKQKNIEELLRRTTQIERMMQGALRIPRAVWHRLLPIRRIIARLRGRA